MLPFIMFAYGTETFGQFSLIWGVMNLVTPILCIGGTTAIIREGTTNVADGAHWTKFFYLVTILGAISLFVIATNVDFDNKYSWIYYSLALAVPNTLILIRLSELRTLENTNAYLILSIWKLSLILLCLYFAITLKMDFYSFLLCTLMCWLLLWLAVNQHSYKEILTSCFQSNEQSKYSIIKYCIFLIPHILATWVLSTSDKLLIDHFLNEYQLGLYSIAYTLGTVLVVFNAGLAIALPRYMYKDVTYFSSFRIRNILVLCYTAVALIISVSIIALLKIDATYSGFINEPERVVQIFAICCLGVYLFGLSQIYSIYIFYHRATRSIAYASITCALLNVILNMWLIPREGIMGAAASTTICYGVYLSFVYLISLNVEKRLVHGGWYHSLVALGAILSFSASLISLANVMK